MTTSKRQGDEVIESRTATVGPMTVRRALPTRGHRTVGAWCFADHMGPLLLTERTVVDVAPHPHLGLQTVTWLFDGELVHHDSLGSEQSIRPGQLNLMSAGSGIAHSEERPVRPSRMLHGMQLWVAQPATTRWSEPAFEHHSVLPTMALESGIATVLVGSVGDTSSSARRDTDHVGVDLDLRVGRNVVPVASEHEHAVIVAVGEIDVNGITVTPGHLAFFAPGRNELVLESHDTSRAVLVGGKPFNEQIVMWWNFVARTHDELADAYRGWAASDERFGHVDSVLARTTVAPPPWLGSQI